MSDDYKITVCDFLASGLIMIIAFCFIEHLVGGFSGLPTGQPYILIALYLVFFILYETINGEISISNRCLNLLESIGILYFGATAIFLLLAMTRQIFSSENHLIVTNLFLMLLAVLIATVTTVFVMRRIPH